ncbi:MAG: P1 family peptidase, partial [Chloroflexi bacterium]|nr:P1 family peptidase [Chloroflexota bacterium]
MEHRAGLAHRGGRAPLRARGEAGVTHDHLALDGITDVPGIKVGHWTNRRAATGCTVVLCPPAGAVGGVDVRGGAPGTRETELLRPGMLVQRVHAVVLAGGSAFGLDAAGGVMRYLEEREIGFAFGGAHVPLVPAGVIFDLGIGRASVRPDAEAGYRAAAAARGGRVAQGSVGAGTGATVARAVGLERCLKGGVGTASARGPEGLIAGALAVVNATGDVVDPDSGRRIAGPRAAGGGLLDGWAIARAGETAAPAAGEHTTLAVVATNARLSKEQTNRLASLAHDGFARAIRPVHTMTDGDTVFALATGEVEIESPAAYR